MLHERLLMSGDGGFGDGSDGDVTISTAVSWETNTAVDHTGFIVKQFTNLTITPTGNVTPTRFNKGIWIFCTGNVTINGTLNNSLYGSKEAAPNGFAKINLRILPQPHFSSYPTTGRFNGDAYSNKLTGAAGGAAGIDGQCGGGGFGHPAGIGGSGAAGLAFCGGGGGGGAGYCGTGCWTTGQDAQGAAGGGLSGDSRWASCGGAGIPNGGVQQPSYGGYTNPSQTGCGGTIWLYVKGTLTLGSTSQILSVGGAGGGGTGCIGPGGASGGGAINIFYKTGLVANAGYTINTAGGDQNLYGNTNTTPGAGSLRVAQVDSWI